MLLLAILAGALLACISEREVPVHGWWNERGPVIRHADFPADCTLCHKGKTWTELVEDFEFDHQERTGYALEGAHAQAKCLRCHNDRGPVEIFARQGCGGCHEDIHSRQLGRECETCHGEQDWQPQGQIGEHQRTAFPLQGAHLMVPCWRCHEAAERGFFQGLDRRCEACHRDVLLAVAEPDHQLLGWTNSCDRCHLATSWTQAGFLHPAVGSGCITCHQADYFEAVNPAHTPDSFPNACQFCHDNESWSPAPLDHPYPRVLIHAKFTCDQCHIVTGQFQQFSCTHCHWHEEKTEDYNHQKVRGYVWENLQCIACHPDGH